jgi:hypothetical protein
MSLQELLSGFQSCSTNSSQAVFELFENTLLTLIQESSRTGDTVRWWANCRLTTLGVTHREWGSTTDTWSDDEAEAVEYLHSLFDCAVKYHDTSTDELSSYHQQRETDLNTALTKIGTGKGPLNGGLEALAKGPVALHSELDEAPQPITLILAGQSWTDLADRSTGVRALAAIAVLGSAFDIRLVISPGLEHHLGRRY